MAKQVTSMRRYFASALVVLAFHSVSGFNVLERWILFAEHGEGLQVLQYKESEKYEAHYDYFHDAFNTKNGGQRIATVLMYL